MPGMDSQASSGNWKHFEMNEATETEHRQWAWSVFGRGLKYDFFNVFIWFLVEF